MSIILDMMSMDGHDIWLNNVEDGRVGEDRRGSAGVLKTEPKALGL